jgi:HK97 gp10 family phage protein
MGRSIEIKKYGDWKKAMDNGIKAGNIELCMRVTAQTKVLSPVAPKFGGALRNSWMWKADKQEGGFNDSPGEKADDKITVAPGKFEGYVGSNVDYSVYPEFGTCKMKPQPSLRPAIDLIVKGTNVQEVLAKIQKEEANGPLREGVERVNF